MATLGDRLLFATHNEGKVEELRALFQPLGVGLVSARELGLPEPAETETTFVGNARIKAHAAARASGLPALADDSGLCVDALGGAPGVYTADWAEGPGGRDFLRAMTRTYDALLANGAKEPWSARFRCTLVLAFPDGQDEVYEGEVSGRLVWPLRGALGHGYDPMFMPDGDTRTFAEMAPDEKNAVSHRARALEALIAKRFT
ncbi:MAG: RdgB/HAM1 family non-canonical purine NTP pyrophosphatase [Rhodobacter sp.]|uniref:RdgB/HAM1 family non-canonical purine NTP pyrophosphatase n=1 Tax=Pararhodobacter sp. TaxID=2127056 RepID=UPI001DE7CE24|nr:RdgB/HAM1 family non-canonical purine NTP pyrophosphatase [Pararhodobacter sp.]MCB1344501.1 RdgB/HAM1 family non-canonical purine NTP pyrophosphatase [Paracoccaceae bacterium]MCC0072342.1 RdgB/HAM1 family non-canonical purine NTP pyrophosphatase [Rhodobacter sp.]HPD91518.1 RdgB/HAM1 family non-canonical purine NTP pyrophosphatase [Pararhodobacter sp.]